MWELGCFDRPDGVARAVAAAAHARPDARAVEPLLEMSRAGTLGARVLEEAQFAARLQHSAQLAQRAPRVRHSAEDEAGDRGVEVSVLEGERVCLLTHSPPEA